MNRPLANAFCTSWPAISRKLLRLGRRRDDQVHGKVAAARQRRRHQRDRANAGDLRQRALRLHQQLLRGLGPLAPRLGHHAAEAAGRERELKDALGLGKRSIDVVDLLGEQLRLLDRRVRRGLDDREDDALVLGGRELPLREHVERHDQQRDDHPQHEDDRPIAERAAERAAVARAARCRTGD